MNTSPSLPPVSASPQGVARIAALLRLVAVHQGSGLRYTEIAELSGLERPTAHRVLKSMVEEELLVRDPATRRYRLGALIAELGRWPRPFTTLVRCASRRCSAWRRRPATPPSCSPAAPTMRCASAGCRATSPSRRRWWRSAAASHWG
ncbi:helix-turn-helix domain-containing protein [Comamonas endophytica]|uniref:helix-turn-helix domain-containing protein n=1 Tax=Comamonas endophytica TaxID=2949090 RepID=UPI00360B6A1B